MTSHDHDGGGLMVFALILRYVVPLERIDELLEDHRRYLERFYADGTFLVSGRQVPRTGGFILALARDRAAIEAVTARDPFTLSKVAEYDIVEVAPTKAVPAMQAILADRGVAL